MSKKRIRNIGALVLAVALAVALLVRAVWINTVFPPIRTVQIPMGEPCTYNGFEMSVTRFGMQRLDQVFQADEMQGLDRGDYTALGPLADSYALFVTLTVKNTMDAEASIPFYELALTDTVWSNDFDLPMFQFLNEGMGVQQTLKSGETITVTLPYILTRAQFTQARWDRVERADYYLDVAVYPEHISLLVSATTD